MKKTILFIYFIFGFSMVSAQNLHTVYPISSKGINLITLEDGSLFSERFNITISKEKNILYAGKFVYRCDFSEYYEYLIEIFESTKNYLIVSPLRKTNYKGVATPYNMDRGIVFLIDLKSGKKYYASLDEIRKIQPKEVFELAKDRSDIFTIKDIDEKGQELILLQGGKKMKKVRIRMHQY